MSAPSRPKVRGAIQNWADRYVGATLAGGARIVRGSRRPSRFLKALCVSAAVIGPAFGASDTPMPTWAQTLADTLSDRMPAPIVIVPKERGIASMTCETVPQGDEVRKTGRIQIHINPRKAYERGVVLEHSRWLMSETIRSELPLEFVGYHEALHGMLHCQPSQLGERPSYLNTPKRIADSLPDFRKALESLPPMRHDEFSDMMARMLQQDYENAYEEAMADTFAFLMMARTHDLETVRRQLDAVIATRFVNQFEGSEHANHDTVHTLEALRALSDAQWFEMVAGKNVASVVEAAARFTERTFPAPDVFVADRQLMTAAKSVLLALSPDTDAKQRAAIRKALSANTLPSAYKQRMFATADRYLRSLTTMRHHDSEIRIRRMRQALFSLQSQAIGSRLATR